MSEHHTGPSSSEDSGGFASDAGGEPTNSSAAPRLDGDGSADRLRVVRWVSPLLLAIVAAIPLWAFTWSAARIAPRDLPIGVAGQPPAVAAASQRLGSSGAFDVHRYADETAARTAIKHRAVYAAIVVGTRGSTLLTASAASPAVASLITEATAAGPMKPSRVVDVVPADPQDPRGTAFASAALPLVIVSVLGGIAVANIFRSARAQVVGVAVTGVVVALVAIGIVQGWLGVLGGDWLASAGALALGAAAIAGFVVGAERLLGVGGLALGAPLMVFIGNPFAGVTSAPELLPHPAGLIGRLMPPGALGSLLRSTAFFDGHGAAGPVLVLVVWLVIGLAALGLGSLRHRPPAAA